MSNETASSLLSLWLAYVLQSGAGYLLLFLVCRFVRDPQFRFRLRGVFLGLMVAAWPGLLLLTGMSRPGPSVGAAFARVSETPASWTFHLALTARASTLLSGLCWAYAAIVALLLLVLLARFRQLRTLIRSSRPASESLSSLFDSVCSSIHAPRCELRLVDGLLSPAATGWLRPKILVPDEFPFRLDTPQLVSILRHELTHVRRRDYLWDRLATFGCYIVFFHPAAWILRRHLRWDRELACDRSSVDQSDASRLEYAACLTALAKLRVYGEGFTGSVDFLSSPTLLGARVRAMVSPCPQNYSATKKAVMAGMTALSLTIALRLLPEVTVTPFSPPGAMPSNTATMTAEAAPSVQHLSTAERNKGLQRHRLRVQTKLQRAHNQLASATPQSSSNIRAESGPSPHPDQPKPVRGPLWRVFPNAGGWAFRSVKSGVSKVGSHLGFGRHPKEPSAQLGQ